MKTYHEYQDADGEWQEGEYLVCLNDFEPAEPDTFDEPGHLATYSIMLEWEDGSRVWAADVLSPRELERLEVEVREAVRDGTFDGEVL